ncbi:hypothetical protein FRC03_011288 [Tulasnella sp. 419]|nr:hypothetical protein FRC03_011288 [Tulasnella sp. 419]
MSPTTTQPPYGLPPSSSSSQGHGSYGQEGHAIRPPFARNNTQVYIVDDKPHDGLATIDEHSLLSRSYPGSGTLEQSTAPSSSSHTHLGLAYDDSQTGHNDQDEIITLGDIPQLLESEQAREQHRSLPRQAGKPLLAELTPLELCIVKHFAVLALQRSTHLKGEFELDEILELIEVKKSTFWNKWFNKGGDKNKVKKKGVFGVPLELLVEQGTDSMLGSSRAPLRVPIFIDDVISAMKQMDMSVEGIFRKNGNIRRLRELTESIDRDPSAVDLTQENPVQLAALLKKFLRDLPDPLMTFKLHKLWNAVVALPTEAERKRFLHILSVILPKGNRDTLEALFVFLKWVASFAHVDEETGSKMDLQNLATVICPSILYAKGREAAREDSFTAIPVVAELLEDQDYFYTVPDEFLPVLQDQEYFANALDMPTKEVLKKAENYLKVKQARGYPAPSNSGGMPMSNSAAFGDRNGNNPANGRGDGNDTKLIPQRSDPNLPRGRSPNLGPSENGGLRNPPPLRIPTHSRSRERQQQPLSAVEPPGQGRDRLPSHPGIPHQQYNQGPPSPRSQQRPSEQPWGGTSPRPTQAGRQPGSRPSSFIRTNGEFLPQPANGRQSPAMGRF